MVTEWKVINLSKNSKIKARIGWQGLTSAEYLEEGYSFLVTGTDFKSGRIDWANCHFVTYERYAQDPNIQISNGDLLLSKDGTIGKVALVTNLKRPATLNSGVFVIKPITEAYTTDYMFYVLESFIFKKFLGQLSAGSTIYHLYQKDIVKFECALPPISEQEKIVGVLSDIDMLISNLQKLIRKKKDIRQGTIQMLLTGKKRIAGYSSAWRTSQLSKVTSRIGVGLATSVTQYYRDSGTIIFRNLNIKENYLDDSDVLFLDEEFASRNPNKVIHEGDVLTVHTGYVGISCVVPKQYDGALTFTTLITTTNRKELLPEYLSYHLNSSLGHRVIEDLQTSGGRNNLNVSDFEKYILSFPSDINEQRAIITVLGDMDNEIRTLDEKLNKYQNVKQGMMEELLTGKVRLM